jgi:hypothetical protein
MNDFTVTAGSNMLRTRSAKVKFGAAAASPRRWAPGMTKPTRLRFLNLSCERQQVCKATCNPTLRKIKPGRAGDNQPHVQLKTKWSAGS